MKKINQRTKSLINHRFKKLVVLEYVGVDKYGQTFWKCKCDCGTIKIIRRCSLMQGTTVSCGCFNKERASKWLTKYANSKSHKGSGNPSWKGSDTKYMSIHQWLNRNYIKTICTHCKTKDKKLDWALKRDHVYNHKRSSFIPLCRSCHLKYDYTDERRNKLTRAYKDKKKTRAISHA